MIEAIALGLGATRPGHVKVKLRFQTWDLHHLRSHMLKTDFRAEPPFIEERSVLLPADKVYARLSAYRGIFEILRSAGVVAQRDRLVDFEIRLEDKTTLAFFEEE